MTPTADLSTFLATYFAGQQPPCPLPEQWTLQRVERAPKQIDEIRLQLSHPKWGQVRGYLAPRRAETRSFQNTQYLALSFQGESPTPAVRAGLVALRTALAVAELTLGADDAAAIWTRDTLAENHALPSLTELQGFLRKPGTPAGLRLTAASLLLQLGQTDAGLAALDRLAAEHLSAADLRAVLDRQFQWNQEIGRYGRAQQALEAIRTLAPDEPKVHAQWLAFWLELGAPERAADLPLARSLDAADLLNAARILNDLGNPAGLELLARAQVAAGQDADRQTDVARAWLHAGEDARAVALLGDVLARDPGHVAAHLVMTQRHLWLGDWPAAAAQLSHAQTLAPDRPDVLLDAGVLAFMRGELDQAMACLERSAAARPTHGETFLWLAEVLCARGDFAAGSLRAQHGVRLASDGLSRHVIGDLVIARAQGPLLKTANFADGLRQLTPKRALGMALPSEAARKAVAILTQLAFRAVRHQEPRRRQTLGTLAKTRVWLGALSYQHWTGLSAPQGSDHHFHGYAELMAALLPDTPPATEATSRDELLRHRQELLRRLRGNRSPHLVVVAGEGSDARLHRVVVPPGVRTACEAVQKSIRYQSPAAALAGFGELFQRFPGSQHPYAFRGELHLWLGNYADARADFCAALQCAMPTRWALYGLGAAATLEGDYHEATLWFDLAKATLGDLGTVFAYRGDLAFETGRFAEALVDLRQAIARTPARIGATVTLALAEHAAGQSDALTARFRTLQQLAPHLLADAALALKLPFSPNALPSFAEQIEVLRQARQMLRGNRSSTCATYFAASGELRCLPNQRHVAPRVTTQELALLRPLLG